MNLKRLMISIAAMAIVALGNAQGFPGGPPPGGPPPGGPGFGGPPMMDGLMPSDMLVQRPDVQADLELTSDQKTKLSSLRDQMRQKMQSMFESGQADPEEGRQAMESFRKQMTASVNSILSDDQKTRLHQIAIQIAGIRAIADQEVQKELGLTSDQKTQINSIQDQARSAGDSIREKIQSGEIDREQAQQSMRKNDSTLKSLLSGVLTDVQKDKLKTMGGKPFKQTSQGFGPGGPGGPGGDPNGPPPPPPGGEGGGGGG